MERNVYLKEFLKRFGVFIRSETELPSSYTYRKTPFTPQKMAGLVVHSLLSSTPEKNFYTDGRFIYYAQGRELDLGHLTQSQKQDVIREDEIFRILDANPSDYRSLYERVADHLRIMDFTPSFNGGGTNNSQYNRFLEEISKQIPYSLVRRDEQNKIFSRIQRNYGHLSDLLSALRSDKHEDISDRLERGLTQYGYSKSA